MSATSPSWVVVDDTSADIVYAGNSWFADLGSQDGQGNFGSPYRSTLHGTKSSSSLSFDFTGSQVKVIGTTNIRNDTGVIDPRWECFVDQTSIGSADIFPYAENNWVLCSSKQLSDGPHTLTVQASVAKSQTFWIDAIQYVPSATVSLASKEILVDNLSLEYGSGWGPLGNVANMTRMSSSVFNYEFRGVSLSWYGFIPGELPGDATTGSYTIDDQPPQKFTLTGHKPSDSMTVYNQKFFETPSYPEGIHKLSVGFDGTSQTTPLTLDYLVIKHGISSSAILNPPPITGTHDSSSNTTSQRSNSTAGAVNSRPSTSANSSSSGSTNVSGTSQSSNFTADPLAIDGSESKSGVNIGGIVGGVIGSVVVLILLVILVFFYIGHRRTKRRRLEGAPIDTPMPFMYPPSTVSTMIFGSPTNSSAPPIPSSRPSRSSTRQTIQRSPMPNLAVPNLPSSRRISQVSTDYESEKWLEEENEGASDVSRSSDSPMEFVTVPRLARGYAYNSRASGDTFTRGSPPQYAP